ncbi:MAG: restriction endonuclease [Blastochloris sp.]|nr:restriction endonuclease [Blastochloris sp.]
MAPVRRPVWQHILYTMWHILVWFIGNRPPKRLPWLRQMLLMGSGIMLLLLLIWAPLYATALEYAFLLFFGPVLLVSVSVVWVFWQRRDTWWIRWKQRFQPGEHTAIAQVDTMSGHTFEQYVATLLQHQGYHTEVTPGSGDMGVDIIAKKHGQRTAIQCKRQQDPVGRHALSDAVAGKEYYRCQQAMVVTNATFTKDAMTFAATTGCQIVDRTTLQLWMVATQRSARQQQIS